MGLFLQWTMAERKLGVSCCFEVWSFMTKSIFPSALRNNTCTVFTRCCPATILGDPGAVSRVGRKGGTKVFKYGRRASGYRLSPNYFQTFKQMPAPSWAQKMLCIIVPNQGTALLSSFGEFVLTTTIRELKIETFSGRRRLDWQSKPLEQRKPSLPSKIRTLRSHWTQEDGALEDYRRGKYGFT